MVELQRLFGVNAAAHIGYCVVVLAVGKAVKPRIKRLPYSRKDGVIDAVEESIGPFRGARGRSIVARGSSNSGSRME